MIHIIATVLLLSGIAFGLVWLLGSRSMIKLEPEYGGMRHVFAAGERNLTLFKGAEERRALKQGDVVAYQLPGKDVMAGRIAAIRNDRVSAEQNALVVGEQRYGTAGRTVADSLQRFPEVPVPRGCAWIVVDRGGEEIDSRLLGPIPLRFVLGRLKVTFDDKR
jgi:hypothetical protein